ncbi:GTP-binding protein [Tistrella bauzanensis]
MKRIMALNAGARIMDRDVALNAVDTLISPLPYAPDAHGDTARAWLAAEAAADRMACADGSCTVPGHRHHHEHGHDHDHHQAADARIATAMRTLPAGTPQDRIVRAADHLAAAMGPGLLRLKGLLPAEGERPPLALHGVQHRLYPPMPLNADASLPDKPTLVAITIDADPAAALDSLVREALS